MNVIEVAILVCGKRIDDRRLVHSRSKTVRHCAPRQLRLKFVVVAVSCTN
jgi:hypothetical protein